MNAETPGEANKGRAAAKVDAVGFNDVYQTELRAILTRRAKLASAGNTPPKDTKPADAAPAPDAKGGELKIDDLVGVTLPGGGIRSATFCLGALQALHAYGALPRVDYLSTVSGGGYIGGAMVREMGETGKFPFAEPGMMDSEAVRHIRDNSRYLFPKGVDDLMRSLGIMIRGILVNIILVLGLVLSLATITILANPTIADLHRSFMSDVFVFLGWATPESAIYPYLADRFFLTKSVLAVLAVALVIWGLYRSALEQALVRDTLTKPEYESGWATFSKWALIILAVTFVGEFQTLIIEWIIDFYRKTDGFKLPSIISSIIGLASASTVLALFRGNLINVIAKAFDTPTMSAMIQAWLAKAALYVGALVLPLVIYFIYLMISASGIAFHRDCPTNPTLAWLFERLGITLTTLCLDAVPNPPKFPLLPFDPDRTQTMFVLLIAVTIAIVVLRRVWTKGATWQAGFVSRLRSKIRENPAGEWLKIALFAAYLAGIVVVAFAVRRQLDPAYWNVLFGFMILAAIAIVIGFAFSENANALHGLYRDRLNAAFQLGRAVPPARTVMMRDLDMTNAPYLLINATLNARRSRLNTTAGSQALDPAQRGRNADFFIFSRDYFGSESTGYASTLRVRQKTDKSGKVEQVSETLGVDLATAVAVSGAAVSSNSGRLGLGMLSPTLALLNLRLGYWMGNPRYVNADPGSISQTWAEVFRFYLLQEAFGRLRTDSKKVFLSDGGHIENIGLYQLLKRRCKLIIVFDAEADPALNFGALADAQRFARIDLGYRVNIEWQPIRERSAERMKDLKKRIPLDSVDHCMHFAIGEILYSDSGKPEDKGILLYVKANMTGDEADYVTDYERRYPTFPHETTIDQLFSEEQMEAYRALGFHSLSRALATDKGFVSDAAKNLVEATRKTLGIEKPTLSSRSKPESEE